MTFQMTFLFDTCHWNQNYQMKNEKIQFFSLTCPPFLSLIEHEPQMFKTDGRVPLVQLEQGGNVGELCAHIDR